MLVICLCFTCVYSFASTYLLLFAGYFDIKGGGGKRGREKKRGECVLLVIFSLWQPHRLFVVFWSTKTIVNINSFLLAVLLLAVLLLAVLLLLLLDLD